MRSEPVANWALAEDFNEKVAQQPFQSINVNCRRNVENVEEIRTFRRKHHRGEKGRAEIEEVYLPSLLERTPQLCSWW